MTENVHGMCTEQYRIREYDTDSIQLYIKVVLAMLL
jgi:hypothetical protein